MPTSATDEFMAVVAHDLRNPIAVLRASAQMALRQVDRGDLDAARGRLRAMVEQSDRLNEMLETFLDASRIDGNALTLRREPANLADIVREAIERATTAPGRAPRAVQAELAEACNGSFDGPRLGRAIRSLVDNACVYGNPRTPLYVRLTCEQGRASVVVCGGGFGPTQDESHRLFERFFRGHAAAEAGHAGLGLGLYVARGIARAHGGDARRSPPDQSPPDQFEIEIPLEQAA